MRHFVGPCSKADVSVPLSVSLLFQMTVDQSHQLQIRERYVWDKDY